jgi:Tol biopolymer transport system component
MRSDGSRERSLHRWKKRGGDCELGSSWSPDGSSIAFIDIGSRSSGIGIIDVQTRESVYLATPHPVADLSWGTEGLIARMGGRALERPPIRCA